jgi:hypothetical protein
MMYRVYNDSKPVFDLITLKEEKIGNNLIKKKIRN